MKLTAMQLLASILLAGVIIGHIQMTRMQKKSNQFMEVPNENILRVDSSYFVACVLSFIQAQENSIFLNSSDLELAALQGVDHMLRAKRQKDGMSDLQSLDQRMQIVELLGKYKAEFDATRLLPLLESLGLVEYRMILAFHPMDSMQEVVQTLWPEVESFSSPSRASKFEKGLFLNYSSLESYGLWRGLNLGDLSECMSHHQRMWILKDLIGVKKKGEYQNE